MKSPWNHSTTIPPAVGQRNPQDWSVEDAESPSPSIRPEEALGWDDDFVWFMVDITS